MASQTLAQIYITAQGAWNTGSRWAGETAQIGLRCTLHDIVSDERPAKGSRYTIPHWTNVIETPELVDDTVVSGVASWHLQASGIGTVNITAADQADFAADFRTFLDAMKAYTNYHFTWQGVRIVAVDPDGHACAGATVLTFKTPVVGTNNYASLPPEVACCLSLRSPLLGRAGRGRMYIPALACCDVGGSEYVMTLDGTIKDSYADALNAAGRNLIHNIEELPGVDSCGVVVGVMSAGKTQAVRPTEVRVGNHADVQVRRQRQVRETYRSLAL